LQSFYSFLPFLSHFHPFILSSLFTSYFNDHEATFPSPSPSTLHSIEL
jgi:hypothetical protein